RCERKRQPERRGEHRAPPLHTPPPTFAAIVHRLHDRQLTLLSSRGSAVQRSILPIPATVACSPTAIAISLPLGVRAQLLGSPRACPRLWLSISPRCSRRVSSFDICPWSDTPATSDTSRLLAPGCAA